MSSIYRISVDVRRLKLVHVDLVKINERLDLSLRAWIGLIAP